MVSELLLAQQNRDQSVRWIFKILNVIGPHGWTGDGTESRHHSLSDMLVQ